MNTDSLKRFVRDPRTLVDFMYWGVRGIRVIALKVAYENDHAALLGLSTLAKAENQSPLKETPLANVVGATRNDIDTKELGELFTKYGSDKATKHDYYLLYSFLLKDKRALPIQVFEIGLGTNNTSFTSNMGVDGKPGASLRAFRDWAPNAKVFGADIDKGVLFEEERIKTFFVDQTNPNTLESVASEFQPHSFDLIVDDGLHTTEANIHTLNWALNLIKPEGYFVVEDILEKYIPTWHTVAALLSQNYHCQLIKCKAEWVFVVNKK